jgi:laccase
MLHSITSSSSKYDFPDNPPVEFDYNNLTINFDQSLIFAPKSTKVKKLKYNTMVEIVLQDTAFIAVENHLLFYFFDNFLVGGGGGNN